MIIPSDEKIGKCHLGDAYKDEEGAFVLCERSLLEIIEATVTNGRGYEPQNKSFQSNDEVRLKLSLLPERCEFPTWQEDVEEGHPEYSKLYYVVHSMPAMKE